MDIDLCALRGSSANVLHIDVGDFHALDEVLGDARDVSGIARHAVLAGNVQEKGALRLSGKRRLIASSLRSSQTRAEPREDGTRDDVLHGDVSNGDGLMQRAVHCFEGDEAFDGESICWIWPFFVRTQFRSRPFAESSLMEEPRNLLTINETVLMRLGPHRDPDRSGLRLHLDALAQRLVTRSRNSSGQDS